MASTGSLITTQSTGMSLDVEGMRRWNRFQRILTTWSRKDAINEAALHGATRLAEEVRKMIRTVGLVDTASLLNSIGYELIQERKGHAMYVVGPSKEKVLIGKVKKWPYVYGRFLEEGTSTMQPKPFLLPALEASRDQIIKEMKSMVYESILKAL